MKYLSPFTNWRIVVLTIIAALTLMAAAADCDNLLRFFTSKVVAVILGYTTYILGKRWDGKMPELDVFTINEYEED